MSATTTNRAAQTSAVAERLRLVATIDPAAPAIGLGDDWSAWGDISGFGDSLGRLLGAGDLPGTRIGIVMRNRPGTATATVACLARGWCVVALNPLHPSADLAAEVTELDLAVVAADEEDWRTGTLAAAVRGSGALGIAVGRAGGTVGGTVGTRPGDLRVVVPGRPADAGGRPRSPGVAVTMLTSGTTGPAKRVPITSELLDASLAGTVRYRGDAAGTPALRTSVAALTAPIVHTSGLFRLLVNLLDGRRVAMLEKFDVTGLLRLVDEHRVGVLALTPTSIRMILDAEVPPAALASVHAVVCGTAPLDPSVAEEFEGRYGVDVLVAYGATEFAGGIAGWTRADRRAHRADKRGSVGRLHDGVEACVRDPETGAVVPLGTAGRLEVRVPGGAGWQRTTDLVRIDEDRFVWILGRTDDAILRGGFKVAAGKVADVLRTHPDVRDAAVVGVADRRLGQVPVAVVESDRAAPEAVRDTVRETVRAWARERLAPYEVPVDVVVVAALPRSASLKIDHVAVRRLAEDATASRTTPSRTTPSRTTRPRNT